MKTTQQGLRERVPKGRARQDAGRPESTRPALTAWRVTGTIMPRQGHGALPLPLTKGAASRAAPPDSCYTAGGLLTQPVLLSTYLQNYMYTEMRSPPTGQQHQERPVRERILGMLDSGQHWREEEPSCRGQRVSHGRLGLPDRNEREQ